MPAPRDPARADLHPDPADALRIADDVTELIATTLSGRVHQHSSESLVDAFLQEVGRMVVEEGIELSEEELSQLLTEAAAFEVSLRAAAHIQDSLEGLFRKDCRSSWMADGWCADW